MSHALRLAPFLAALALALPAAAEPEPVELDWRDLVPDDGSGQMFAELKQTLGIVTHEDLVTGFEQNTNAEVTTEYDGQRVSLPGFMVPLDFEGWGVSTFLLVPYVGACIHVPPPPPNQIVYVSSDTPYEVTGYFEPITVTGVLHAGALGTELAEIGYTIEADRIVPYE